MRRRELIAGLAGLSTIGGAGWYLQTKMSDAAGIDPVALQTIEAPGSSGEEVTVPAPGSVSLVTFFATWCHICEAEMEPLGEVAAAIDDSVQMVSVTNEPVGYSVTESEVRQWWRDHDGRWPVAVDADLELTELLDISGVPTMLVFDENNVVTWRNRGRASAETILDEIAAVRDGSARPLQQIDGESP